MAIILYNNFWGEWGGERGQSKNRQKPLPRVSLGETMPLPQPPLFSPAPPRPPASEAFVLCQFSKNLKVCLEDRKEVLASSPETDQVLKPNFSV